MAAGKSSKNFADAFTSNRTNVAEVVKEKAKQQAEKAEEAEKKPVSKKVEKKEPEPVKEEVVEVIPGPVKEPVKEAEIPAPVKAKESTPEQPATDLSLLRHRVAADISEENYIYMSRQAGAMGKKLNKFWDEVIEFYKENHEQAFR